MSGGIAIRDATPDDLDAVVAIERASFGDPWSEASFRSLLRAETTRFRVATREGVVTGYAIASRIGDEAELANLAVAPAARRAGLGARLLDDLLATTDAEPAATVYLEVRAGNEPAQALYRSRGFTAVGRRKGYYSRPAEDAVVMRHLPSQLPDELPGGLPTQG
jgi:[ribosomal protein S18]-alanine N-acetyltransferase